MLLIDKLNFPKQIRGLFPNNSYAHESTKFQIAHKLLKDGFEVYPEQDFKSGGRADLVAIDKYGNGFIIEVLETETEEEFRLNKLEKYPQEFTILSVKCKDFDILKWYL